MVMVMVMVVMVVVVVVMMVIMNLANRRLKLSHPHLGRRERSKALELAHRPELLCHEGPDPTVDLGLGLRSKLRRVAESGRRRETVEDSGSLLLGVFRASNHEQETLGVLGSTRK